MIFEISPQSIGLVGSLIAVINFLWGIVLIMLIAFVRKVSTSIDELNSASTTLSKGLAVLDTKMETCTTRVEVVARRVHDLGQDVGFIRGQLSSDHAD